MVNDALTKLNQTVDKIKDKFGKQKIQDIDVSKARTAGLSIEATLKKNETPNRSDVQTFDNIANKLNALVKRLNPTASFESTYDVNDMRILLEGCIEDNIDGALETITLVIEAYDFMNDEINELFDIAQYAIDIRL